MSLVLYHTEELITFYVFHNSEKTHTGILFYTFMSYQFHTDVLLLISVEVFFV